MYVGIANFIQGVIGALRDAEERLLPDLEYGEDWRQFCRVAVAAATPVPAVLRHLERLLEKWVMASGHGNKSGETWTGPSPHVLHIKLI